MPLPIILLILFVLLVVSLRQVNQYEQGIMLTMGRFTGVKGAGWRLVVPVFQQMKKVDLRVKAVDVPDQNAITRDNVSVKVNAVIYYKVSSAEKAILEVEDFKYAISQYAQTTMRNIVGEATLDELLANREQIAERIRDIVDKETDAWGLKVSNVELKDVSLPPDMERTIAKQAEAEREKRAVIITSEGELAAAQNVAKAAQTLAASPRRIAPAHSPIYQRHFFRQIQHRSLRRPARSLARARRVEENCMRKLTADFIFLVHFALVALVSLGWLIPGFFYAHLTLLALTLISELTLGYCVLTRLEFGLRRKMDPTLVFDKSCMVHYTRKWRGLAPRIPTVSPTTFFKRNSFLFILLGVGVLSVVYRFWV